MYIIEILSLTTKTHRDVLSYFSKDPIELGTIIEAPFRKGTIRGVVHSITPLEKEKSTIKNADFALRKIGRTRKLSLIDPILLETIRIVAEREYVPTRTLYDRLLPEVIFDIPMTLKIPTERRTGTFQKILIQAPREHRAQHYRAEIRAAFARGESIVLVAPTHSSAKAWYDTLARGIEHYTVFMSGSLTRKEQLVRTEQLLLGATSHPFLYIATPTFLTLLPHTTGHIILEHEHENTWLGMVAPLVDMRGYITTYAEKRGITLTYGDMFLRLETSGVRFDDRSIEARELNWQYVHPCKIEINERHEESKITRTSLLLSESTRAQIKSAREAGKKILIYTLRNGLSAITFCNDCGSSMNCESCGTPLSLFENGPARFFVCHRCQKHTPSQTICQNCRSWNLVPYALGTEKVFEEITDMYGDDRVFIIDKTHTTGEKAIEKLVQKFEKTKGGILIGSPKTAPYLTEKVDVVILPSLDTLIARPSYTTEEDVLALLLRLETLALDTLIIQTKNMQDSLLATFYRGNYTEWYRRTLAERKVLGYPPYGTIIKITRVVRDKDQAEVVAELEQALGGYTTDIVTSNYREMRGHSKIIGIIKLKDETVPAPLHSILKNLMFEYRISRNPTSFLD